MITPKEKAEAYVRQQLPELMKPEDIKPGVVLRHREGWETKATSEVDEHNGIQHENGYGPIDSFNILGLPIQLHHWLRVLDFNSRRYMVATDGTLCFAAYDKSINPVFNFNLTTGQPATKADYQAFNKIMGI